MRSAARAIACSPEEQKRLMVIAEQVTGRPARSDAMRATLLPCSASGIAQPRMTSSTSLDSRPGTRLIASWMTAAAISSGRVLRRVPRGALPPAVRAMDTMTASFISTSESRRATDVSGYSAFVCRQRSVIQSQGAAATSIALFQSTLILRSPRHACQIAPVARPPSAQFLLQRFPLLPFPLQGLFFPLRFRPTIWLHRKVSPRARASALWVQLELALLGLADQHAEAGEHLLELGRGIRARSRPVLQQFGLGQVGSLTVKLHRAAVALPLQLPHLAGTQGGAVALETLLFQPQPGDVSHLHPMVRVRGPREANRSPSRQ